ncbi:MAG TPA: hypothetical protein VGK95_10630 [Caldimonas sp.]
MLPPTGAKASSPGADELDSDFGAEWPLRAGERVGDVGMEAARMGGVPGPCRHRHGGAVDLHGCAAHAARVAEGDEQHRRVTVQARARVLGLRHQRRALVPGRTQACLQHVTVDLEDAAVARLDGDVALDVERRRGCAQLVVAPLGHRLFVLAFALRHFPGLAAVARDDRAEQRLRRGQAGGDAPLGLAQPALALGDDSAHRLQGEHEGEEDGAQGDRLAEQGKAAVGHGCAFFDELRRHRRRRRQDRPRERRQCEGDTAPRPGR